MTKTDTIADLLQVCLWDLHAGARDLASRLPAVARHATDERLATQLAQCLGGAQARAERLTGTDMPTEGPENLWMGGILDDAERDTQSIMAGRLLDLAMIGAVRKALVAELASTDTALAIAGSLSAQAELHALAANAAALRQEDQALEALLAALA